MRVAGYSHEIAAHCESGAARALLRHAGLPVSEPMVFGIGSGIFFGYFATPALPFPMIAMRNRPGDIWKNLAKRAGVALETRTFKTPEAAEAALDSLLAQGVPTAVQVDFFHMTYVPRFARAHFNAHYVVVVGREGDEYVVSDPYAPDLARLPVAEMRLGRAALGQFAPRGRLYRIVSAPARPDPAAGVVRGIRQASSHMRHLPIPFLGVRGIRRFAEKVTAWPRLARDEEHLAHEMMSIPITIEDRGTGGGGFRYLYASFLQEAAAALDNRALAELAREFMADGDAWREIALFVARASKAHDFSDARLGELRRLILERADVELDLFRRLAKAV